MRLEELRDGSEEMRDEEDCCSLTLIDKHPILNVINDPKVEFPFSTRKFGKDRKVVIVVNDKGQAEYKMRDADGRLGAVEDC